MFKLRLAVFLAFATLLAHAQAPGTTSQPYVLSGANGGQFSVDDDIVLKLNGVTFFDDTPAYSGLRNPISFNAKPGDALFYGDHDTYGFCNGLDPLYLSCKGSTTYTLVTTGRVEACGFAPGDGGIVFMGTYTIPTSLPGCTSAASIASVEVTQAIQQYQALADLKASLAANGEPPVPIISLKPAVLRIYFAAVTDVTQVSVNLYGVNAETKYITLQPNCSPEDQRAGNNGCQSMDFYFTPPSGTWNAELVLMDSNGKQIDDENLVFKSRDTAPVILRGIAGCSQNANTLVKTCGSGSEIYSLTTSASTLLPTPSVSPVYAFGSVSQYNLYSTDPNYFQKNLAATTAALYGSFDKANDYLGGSYTDFVSIYDPTGIGTSSAWAAGSLTHGLTIPIKFITFDADTTPDTLTHEVGHTLNLQHTNSITPLTKTGPAGCDLPAEQNPTSYPFPNNYIQSTATSPEYGFNVSTQTIINGYTNFELMGYCAPTWITPFSYKRMIPSLNGGVVTSPSAVPGPVQAEQATPAIVHPRTPPPAPVTGQFWQIAGALNPTGLTLNPVFLQTTQGTSDPGTGTDSIQVLGTGGQVLYSRAFTPTSPVTETMDPNFVADVPRFSEWIPYTAGAASFAVLDPNGATLVTLPITGVAPTVAFTSPAAAFTGAGTQSVAWTITDPDSTSFSSRVYYSPDNGTNWYPVSQTTQTATFLGADTVDFNTVPGSATALLRVYVTDGVNTGVATTAAFNAPRHLPTSIAITAPLTGTTQAANNPVYLAGGAFDPDDGILAGKALVWSSDVQGALGTGSPLIVTLKPGTHTLTLTATDSDGNSLTATTKITLGGAPPALTLSSAATGACTTATIAAVPGALGAPLSLVQYNLDGGVTYVGVPLTSLPLSLPLTATGAVEVLARAYDASKQYAAQSIHLTLATACTSQTLNAVSGSGQTTVVGTSFPAPLVAQVVDSTGKGIAGVSVSFSGPISGANASFTTPVVTAADGTASVTPTANTTLGAYTITASAAGIASSASFALANTDFSIAVANASPAIFHGTSMTQTLTLTALGGFNSATQLSCSGLPAGVTCSFSPATLTPTGGTATSQLTITASADAMQSAGLNPHGWRGGMVSAGTISLCSLLGFFTLRRRRRLGFVLTLLLTAALFSASGCAHFKLFSSNITVNAKTATATRTTTISLSVL